MRRLTDLIIPIPVAIVFLCTFAWAGWHFAGKAAQSGLELQISQLDRLTR